jgi:exopolysaccharide biosynthesis polyprenyl glycosylphosphotransferase
MHPIDSIRSIPRRRAWLVGTSHAFGLGLAMLAAVSLQFGWRDGLDYLAAHHVAMSAQWGIFCVVLGSSGMYDSDRRKGLLRTLGITTLAVLGGTMLATALLWATSSWDSARAVLLNFTLLALLAVLAMQLIDRLMRGAGFLTNRCLVIGTNGEARRAVDLIDRHPHAGLQIVGIVHRGSAPDIAGPPLASYQVLGTEDELTRLVQRHRADTLIVAAPGEAGSTLLMRLRSFRHHGVTLANYVSLHEELTQEVPIEDINDEWLFAASMNSSRPRVRRFKRAFDVAASLGALVVTAPVVAVTAVWVALDSPGPILHRQERLGRTGTPFTILKFRTMAADAESRTGPVWATEGDPRITRAGRWLRRFHIDEIPQFINVLAGEMSLIGPRPEREVFVKRLAEEIPFYTERLTVHPGITGWAQVMQSYAASTEESRQKLQADLYYIKHMSFLTDMHIILKTVKIVVFGHEPNRPVGTAEPIRAMAGSRALTTPESGPR